MAPIRAPRRAGRTFDAIPDAPHFRDTMFQATQVEVPSRRNLAEFRQRERVPTLDQGREGACAGSRWRPWCTTCSAHATSCGARSW
jgi:hypothetical protein